MLLSCYLDNKIMYIHDHPAVGFRNRFIQYSARNGIITHTYLYLFLQIYFSLFKYKKILLNILFS